MPCMWTSLICAMNLEFLIVLGAESPKMAEQFSRKGAALCTPRSGD